MRLAYSPHQVKGPRSSHQVRKVRLSHRAELLQPSEMEPDAGAIVTSALLAKGARDRWAPDRTKAPPVLVPLLSLGRRVVATEGTDARAGTFSIKLADVVAGGLDLRATSLSSDLLRGVKDEKGVQRFDGHEGRRAQGGA